MFNRNLASVTLAGFLLVGAAGAASADESEAMAAWKVHCGGLISSMMTYPATKRNLPDAFSVAEAVIDRSGRVLEARLVEKSGQQIFDRESQAFVRNIRNLPRLPDDFADERAVVRMYLVYADNAQRAARLKQKIYAAAETATTRTVEIDGVQYAGVPVIRLSGGF